MKTKLQTVIHTFKHSIINTFNHSIRNENTINYINYFTLCNYS